MAESQDYDAELDALASGQPGNMKQIVDKMKQVLSLNAQLIAEKDHVRAKYDSVLTRSDTLEKKTVDLEDLVANLMKEKDTWTHEERIASDKYEFLMKEKIDLITINDELSKDLNDTRFKGEDDDRKIIEQQQRINMLDGLLKQDKAFIAKLRDEAEIIARNAENDRRVWRSMQIDFEHQIKEIKDVKRENEKRACENDELTAEVKRLNGQLSGVRKQLRETKISAEQLREVRLLLDEAQADQQLREDHFRAMEIDTIDLGYYPEKGSGDDTELISPGSMDTASRNLADEMEGLEFSSDDGTPTLTFAPILSVSQQPLAEDPVRQSLAVSRIETVFDVPPIAQVSPAQPRLGLSNVGTTINQLPIPGTPEVVTVKEPLIIHAPAPPPGWSGPLDISGIRTTIDQLPIPGTPEVITVKEPITIHAPAPPPGWSGPLVISGVKTTVDQDPIPTVLPAPAPDIIREAEVVSGPPVIQQVEVIQHIPGPKVHHYKALDPIRGWYQVYADLLSIFCLLITKGPVTFWRSVAPYTSPMPPWRWGHTVSIVVKPDHRDKTNYTPAKKDTVSNIPFWFNLMALSFHILFYFALYHSYLCLQERSIWLKANDMTRELLLSIRSTNTGGGLSNAVFGSPGPFASSAYWVSSWVDVDRAFPG